MGRKRWAAFECSCTPWAEEGVVGRSRKINTLRPYQFDLLIHEYGDSIFSKKDL